MDVYINPSAKVDSDLAALEPNLPGVTLGYAYLRKLLGEDQKLGWPVDRSDPELRTVYCTYIHLVADDPVGLGLAARKAAVLIFDRERNHTISIQPLGVLRGIEWDQWDFAEKVRAVKQLL
jgi:hypothetical protein